MSAKKKVVRVGDRVASIAGDVNEVAWTVAGVAIKVALTASLVRLLTK